MSLLFLQCEALLVVVEGNQNFARFDHPAQGQTPAQQPAAAISLNGISRAIYFEPGRFGYFVPGNSGGEGPGLSRRRGERKPRPEHQPISGHCRSRSARLTRPKLLAIPNSGGRQRQKSMAASKKIEAAASFY